MAFVKAKRAKVWVKVQFVGTSGSGKTTSALLIADGLAKKMNSGIAFISTEKSRTMYNADKFDYDVEELTDYSPESYIKAIDEAIDAGYKVIIIDSTSHGWQWLNDTHSKMPGNSFQNWGKLKPRWAAFMRKILECPAHVITCARGKTEWAMEEKNGKQTPVKVGLGSEGDKQSDFEYTVSFMLAQGTHIASVNEGGKDNTGLFEDKYEVITRKHGEMLYDWANSGDAAPIAYKDPMAQDISGVGKAELDLADIKKEIVALCVALGGQKNEALMTELKKVVPNGNPNSIRSVDKAKGLLETLKAMKTDE